MQVFYYPKILQCAQEADEINQAMTTYTRPGGNANLHPKLSSLVNYCQSVPFKGFDTAAKNNVSFQMSSFSETAGIGHLRHYAAEFVQYNNRQNSRIYPKGERINSNNFVPQLFWNVGCQMVALNHQVSVFSDPYSFFQTVARHSD